MSKQVIDACCLINSYGSGAQREILESVGGFLIPEYVEQESLKIRMPSPDDDTVFVLMEIDLTPEINDSLLIRCPMEGEAEQDDFIEFASKLDDGEAACLAIAKNRDLIVATDDRKAIRIAQEANIDTISTPAILKRWIESESIANEVAAKILKDIEQNAKFKLKASHELYSWWRKILETK